MSGTQSQRGASAEPVLTLRGSVLREAEAIYAGRIVAMEHKLVNDARRRLGAARCADACCDLELERSEARTTIVCRVYAPAASAPPAEPASGHGMRLRL